MMSRTPAKYSQAPAPRKGQRVRHALTAIATAVAVLGCAGGLGLGASASATEIVAPFATRVNKKTSPNDPLISAIFGEGWYARSLAFNREHHIPGPLLTAIEIAVLPGTQIAVYAGAATAPCQRDFGEVHDLEPRIESCPAKLLIKNGSGWISRDIGSVCTIYNEDGEPADRAFSGYDPEKKELRFWAVLKGKRQSDCDRTVAVAL